MGVSPAHVVGPANERLPADQAIGANLDPMSAFQSGWMEC
jgi:hypothetical protein